MRIARGNPSIKLREQGERIGKWILGAGGLSAAALLVIWLLSGISGPDRGPWRMGWEDDAPEQFPGPDGKPTGLAVDLIREAARRRGIELQWVRRYDGSESALRSGAVDLWPLMTITPERLKVVHISSPYLSSVVSIMVLRDGRLRRPEQLAGQTIGSLPMPINSLVLRRFLPGVRPVTRQTNRELVQALCSGELAGVFMEQDELIHELMASGGGCATHGFGVIVVPGSRFQLGVGSTRRAASEADAIRDEIDNLAADGSLAALFEKWGYLSGHNISSVESLLASRRRESLTRVASVVLALMLLLALWQTFRYRRESTRARLAEANVRRTLEDSRRMEDRLRLLAHALRSASDCISITDPENHLIYVNEAFLRTYEYSEEELIGQPADVLRSSRPDQAADKIIPATMAGENWRGELWNRTKSGREFPISLATSQVRDEQENLIALVGVASDITARREAEEENRMLREQYLQAQKMESIGRLAGGVAHDFNNLLTVISGYTRLISGKITPRHAFHSPITAIARAADRAAELTRQLLTFSRGGAGNAKILCLNDLVQGMAGMLKRLIEDDIEILFSLDGPRGYIHADPGQIEQVIMNLALNARDAMPDGGSIRIEISCVPVTDEFAALCLSVPMGDYVLLTVTDTGLGMTKEVQARMFEPFFTTKEIGKGTGLGLATAYGIVKQSGGSISVHSLQGYGSTFRVFFPAVETAYCPAPVPELENGETGGSETILVVEDESAVREYLKTFLSEHGYLVLEAADGDAAIREARHHQGEIHLLLTDLALPGINGFEIAREVGAIRPGLPVLHMSGYPDRHGLVSDEAGYIQKPFAPAALLASIRGMLDSRLSAKT